MNGKPWMGTRTWTPKWKLVGVAALLALTLLTILPLYVLAPIEGRVVDMQSGAALEGAVVVGFWQLEDLLQGGGSYYLDIAEARTDKDGRFVMGKWRLAWPERSPLQRLSVSQPRLVIFKPGFELAGAANQANWAALAGRPVRYVVRADYSNRDLPLTRLEPHGHEQLAAQLETEFRPVAQYCRWSRTPMLVQMLDSFGARLHAAGKPTRLYPSMFGVSEWCDESTREW